MSDNHSVYLRKWEDVETPTAIVQIAHGMAEHIERYHGLAQFLNNHQIIVYGNDHRGHGETGNRANTQGFLGKRNGFDRTAQDLKEITSFIRNEQPDLPIFLLGHSMGSFLSRRYLSFADRELSGAIFIGTSYQPPLLLHMGKFLARLNIAIQGKKTPATFLNKLTFANYNKKTEANTAFDWLSSDKEIVKNYIEDPYCGFLPSNQFFYDLYEGIGKIQDNRYAEAIDKELPLLFLTGDQDPVSQYSQGMLKAVHFYRKVGLENITYHIFKDKRHELLNEKNKQEIYQYIFTWIKEHITCMETTKSL